MRGGPGSAGSGGAVLSVAASWTSFTGPVSSFGAWGVIYGGIKSWAFFDETFVKVCKLISTAFGTAVTCMSIWRIKVRLNWFVVVEVLYEAGPESAGAHAAAGTGSVTVKDSRRRVHPCMPPHVLWSV